ncbi:MAG: hypothetical protein ACI8QZ_002987 [Chlamydiales bacterium]|jgi:hypothetical protein
MNQDMMRRKTSALFSGVLLLSTLCGLGAAWAAPGDGALESALHTEAARLRELALSPPVAAKLSSAEGGRINALIVGCDKAMAGGQPLLAVRRLAKAGYDLDRLQFMTEYEAVKEQEEVDRLCAESLAGVPALSRSPRPAAIQALMEVAHGRARGFMTSAPVHGAQTRLSNGTYYLAVGRSYEHQARFLASLPWSAPASPVQELPGLASYLDRLDADITELYVPPISITRHPEFIKTSAKLKLARQLFDEGAILGALELGLETRAGLGRLQDRGAISTEWLQESVEEYLARMDEQGVDHSLGRMLLDRAQAGLQGATAGEAVAAQIDAAVILAEALPEYFACFVDDGDEHDDSAQVTVTLVRWPFT